MRNPFREMRSDLGAMVGWAVIILTAILAGLFIALAYYFIRGLT